MIALAIVGAIFGSFGLVGLCLVEQRYRDWRRLLLEVAERVHLRDVTASRLGGISGLSGSLPVNLRRHNQRAVGYGRYGFTVMAVGGDSGLTLRRESAEPQIEELARQREIELGDELFDDEVWVLGSAETARAVLDAETRGTIRRFLGQGIPVSPGVSWRVGFRVEDGALRAWISGDGSGDPSRVLAEILENLLALARKLQRPADPVGRIAENTRSEPECQVRVQNLLLLASSYPHHRATREALKRGCEDEREEVQVTAALALGGEEARPLLLEIATREWSEDSCSARAVAALGEHLPAERLREVLSHALRTGRARTATACLESLGRSGGPAAVEPLAKVLAVAYGPLAVAAAQALGASREAAAEAPLLRALQSAPEPVRAAAAEALGHVGSSQAVLPLKELADARDADGALRRAARQAVAEIQSRLHGASPGQVSLADTDAGGLSLATEDPKGRVSYPGNKRSSS